MYGQTYLKRCYLWALVFSLAIIAGGLAGVYTPANLRIADAMLASVAATTDKRALVVSAPADENFGNTDFWQAMISELKLYGVASIVVLASPEELPADWPYSDVVIAQPLDVENLPPAEPGRVYALPPSHFINAHRAWFPCFETSGQLYRSFQHDLLKLDHCDRVLINFHNAGTLPKVSAKTVIDGGLIGELTRDKTVIVGRELPAESPGYVAPSDSSEHAQRLSNSQLQAYVIQTLKLRSELHFLSDGWLLFFCLLIVVSYVTALIYMPPVWIIPSTLISLISHLALAGLSATALFLVYPTSEMMNIIIVCSIVVLHHRKKSETALLEKVISTANAELAVKTIPKPLLEAGEGWERMMYFVCQQLSISKSVFMAINEETDKLELSHCFQCSELDIYERRRDYGRAPYQGASQARAPILSTRRFFVSGDNDHAEFVSPLYYSGVLLGFWIISIKQSDYPDELSILRKIADIARHIAELIFFLRQLDVNKRKPKINLTRLLRAIDHTRFTYERVEDVVKATFLRMHMLESASKQTSTGFAMYNLFGELIDANTEFERTCAEHECNLGTMGLIDILTRLTSLDKVDAGEHIFDVLNKNVSLEVSSTVASQGRAMELRLFPLRSKDTIWSNSGEAEDRPAGVVVELVDMSTNVEHTQCLIDFFNYFIFYGKVESRSVPADMHCEPELNYSGRLEALFSQASVELAKFDDNNTDRLLPFNPQRVIRKIGTELLSMAVKNQLDFESVLNDGKDLLVRAPLQEFSELLRKAYALLITDAVSGSSINTQLLNDSDSKRVVISLYNKGYGLPNQDFDSIVNQLNSGARSADTHSKLRQLVEARAQSVSWAEIYLSTSLGEGFVINITLESFRFSLDQA